MPKFCGDDMEEMTILQILGSRLGLFKWCRYCKRTRWLHLSVRTHFKMKKWNKQAQRGVEADDEAE